MNGIVCENTKKEIFKQVDELLSLLDNLENGQKLYLEHYLAKKAIEQMQISPFDGLAIYRHGTGI